MVVDLSEEGVTVAVPVFPHMAVLLKEERAGRRRLEGGEGYLPVASFHLSYSFSSIASEVCKYLSSPSVTILLLVKRG